MQNADTNQGIHTQSFAFSETLLLQDDKLIILNALRLLNEVFILHDICCIPVHIWNTKLIESLHNASIVQQAPGIR